MDLVTIIYLGDIVKGLKALCLMAAIPSILAAVVFFIEEERKISIRLGAFSALAWFMFIVIPSKETIYTIAAVKYGEQVLKTSEAKEVGEKVYKILNQKLDEALKDEK